MSSVAVQDTPHSVRVVDNTIALSIYETEYGIEINEVVHQVNVTTSAANEVTIADPTLQLQISAGVPGPQGPTGPAGTLEDLLVDGNTIEGDGVDTPLSVTGMLQISQRLAEFNTVPAKEEAVTNLGLHIIDGGTFTY